MADKIDRLLTDYFKGKLDLKIKLRKMELKTSFYHDENVGGGRIQNNYTDVNLNILIKEEEDKHLQELIKCKIIIDSVIENTDVAHRRVISEYYRSNIGWNYIAFSEHINERTARKWRDGVKHDIKKYLA